MDPLKELLEAALTATPERKEAAVRMLRGEAPSAEQIEPARSEPYLSLRQLGRELGISPSTVWRWQAPSRDLGGRPRYRRSEVEKYLASEAFQRRAASLRAERRRTKSASTPRTDGNLPKPQPSTKQP